MPVNLRQFFREGIQRVKRTPLREFFLPTATPTKRMARKAAGKARRLFEKVPETKVEFGEEAERGVEEIGKGKGPIMEQFFHQEAQKARFGRKAIETITGLPKMFARDYEETAGKIEKGKKLGFWDYANLSDFVPGIGFIGIGGGVKATKPLFRKAAREVAEKGAKEVVEKGVKEVGGRGVREIVEEVSEKTAREIGEERVLRVAGGKYNLADLKVTDDVFQVIEDSAKINKKKISAMRRGRQSDQLTRELAEQLGMTPEQLIKARKGRAFNAEELTAAGDLVKTLREKSGRLTQEYRVAKNIGEATPLMELKALDAANEAALAEVTLLGKRTEAGRALRVNQMIKQALKDPSEEAIEKIYKQYGGGEGVEKLLARYNELLLNEGDEAAYKFLRNIHKPTFKDYVLEFWYNSILSSPTTQLVNNMSNSLVSALSPIERTITAAVEVPTALIQRRGRKRFFGEAAADVLGASMGFKEGVRKALHILAKGYSFQDVAKLELRRPQAFKGAFGTFINLPSRGLVAGDAFFKSVNFSADLYARAYREAAEQGLTGKKMMDEVARLIGDPTVKMLKGAKEIADYKVFQKKPGATVRAFLNLRKKIPMGEFITPFVQTPTNLVKYGLERTPIGVVTAIGKTGPQVSEQLGKAIMGSSIAAALAFYAMDGKITGRGPTNRKDKDILYRAGWQPFSIKIGDKWVSYQRLEPFNQVFTQVASFYDNFVLNKEAPASEKVQGFATDITRNLVSQTYLSGLSDVLNALMDPERYGGNFIERQAASLAIPFSSLFRAITRSTDPVVRDPEGIKEAIMAITPGLSTRLAPKESGLGETIVREGGPLRQMFPIRYTTEQQDVPALREGLKEKQNIRDIDKAIKDGKEPEGDAELITIRKAEFALSKVTNAPRKEQRKVLRELRDSGFITEEIAQKMDAIERLSRRGITKTDRELLLYPPELRAQYAIERLEDFTDVRKKRRHQAMLMKMGIIDEATAQEMDNLGRITAEKRKRAKPFPGLFAQ